MSEETADHEGHIEQWGEEARQALLARAEAVRVAITDYVDEVVLLTGRQRELAGLFSANDVLRSAAAKFDDAAFDLTGTAPLGVEAWDDEDEDEDDAEDETGPVLTVVGRWDYRITDADAVMAAGRRSHLAHGTDDTDEDARLRVRDVESAAGEIMHGDAVARLDETPGLEQIRFATTVIRHDGADEETFDDDPFAIVAGDADR